VGIKWIRDISVTMEEGMEEAEILTGKDNLIR
jgi:hypothetical protein